LVFSGFVTKDENDKTVCKNRLQIGFLNEGSNTPYIGELGLQASGSAIAYIQPAADISQNTVYYLPKSTQKTSEETLATQSWVTNKKYATEDWVKTGINLVASSDTNDSDAITINHNRISAIKFIAYSANFETEPNKIHLQLGYNSGNNQAYTEYRGQINLFSKYDNKAIYTKIIPYNRDGITTTNDIVITLPNSSGILATQDWIEAKNYASQTYVNNKFSLAASSTSSNKVDNFVVTHNGYNALKFRVYADIATHQNLRCKNQLEIGYISI
jgi:hypothetical protein